MSRARAAAVLLVGTLLLSSWTVLPVMAGDARFTYGLQKATSTAYITEDGWEACQIIVWFWMWEQGDSDIIRLKARTELRSPTDSLHIPGTASFSRDYQYSPPFPDDASSYYHYFWARYNVPSGGTYKIRAKMVGEVASWWKPDVVVKADLTTGLGCEKGQVIITP